MVFTIFVHIRSTIWNPVACGWMTILLGFLSRCLWSTRSFCLRPNKKTRSFCPPFNGRDLNDAYCSYSIISITMEDSGLLSCSNLSKQNFKITTEPKKKKRKIKMERTKYDTIIIYQWHFVVVGVDAIDVMHRELKHLHGYSNGPLILSSYLGRS